MADLSIVTAAEVVQACRAGAAEAAAALARALDAQVSLSVGEPRPVDVQALPSGLVGPGLAIVLVVEGQGALVLIPESSGLVPGWCATPDATGQSRLATLAQELGMLLLPEAHMPGDFKASYVQSLAGALARGMPCEGAVSLSLQLSSSGEAKGVMPLVWPIAKPAAVVGSGIAQGKDKLEPKPSAKPDSPAGQAPEPVARPRGRRRAVSLADLPAYARSLLRIRVPVAVTLAEKKQSLSRIVELGPGSIIQFDKSCEEMLDLDVAELPVAKGEAVKVGDKFGLRITSMLLPEERFQPVRPCKPAGGKGACSPS